MAGPSFYLRVKKRYARVGKRFAFVFFFPLLRTCTDTAYLGQSEK